MKLLIIEDNEQDRKIMARFFDRESFGDVVFVQSGEEGLKKADGASFDLVITDTLLPGRNGFEVCAELKKAKPDLKVIVMTGAVDAVDAVKARQAGANDYVVKTADYAHLIEAVKKITGAS